MTFAGDAARQRAAQTEDAAAPLELRDAAGDAEASSGPSETNELLRVLIAVNGRLAFPEERLRDIVSPKGNAAYLRAYSMCNGRESLRSIAKAVGVDHGNLAKTFAKWVDAGIAFRFGPKRAPLHLYALPSAYGTTGEAKADTTTSDAEPRPVPTRRGRRGRPGGDANTSESDGHGSGPVAAEPILLAE